LRDATLEVDIAIAGGGPAGAAAAISLAKAGRRVLLADAAVSRVSRIGEGLPSNTRSLLQELGVLPSMAAAEHRPSPGTLAYWGNDSAHSENTIFHLHGQGWQLDRIRFDAMMRDAARAAGADVVDSTSLRLVQAGDAKTAHRALLLGRRGHRTDIAARWLIDAGGRNAPIARGFGAHRIMYAPLFAFFQRLRGGGATDYDGRTWVEAVTDGWWYSVLLPAGDRLIAFLADPAPAERRRLLDGDGLWRRLANAPGLHAHCANHGWRPHGRARGAEAGSAELDRPAGDRWLAVGDAALSFDPLSSKGISNALYTGICAARCVLATLAGNTQAHMMFAAHLREIHRVHREQLRAFYAMEKRWPASEFWRRHTSIDPATTEA